MQQEWIEQKDVERLSWVVGRNKFADECNTLPVEEILKKYVYLTANDVEHLVSIITKLHGDVFKGVGIELGAGVAIFSAILSKMSSVDRIYALELVPSIVRKIQNRVFEEYGNSHKAIATLGSFDDLKLDNASCDFIIEYDSLHHSFNLAATLKEAYRVLKPGGVLIAIDRIQSNSMHDRLKERLLNFEYGRKWLESNYYDPSVRLTREMNGEHEIRESEWVDAFRSAGFVSVSVSHLTRPSVKMFYYSILTMLPDVLKRRTRYSILSSHPFHRVMYSFFRRNPSHLNIGRFIGCLGALESKQALIKGVIFAKK
jgi:SAM-dependent methyltransferase